MKLSFLFVIIIISSGLIGCQMETAVTQISNQHPINIQFPSIEGNKHLQTPSNKTACSQWESQILATTVRIEMTSSVEFDLDMGREPIFHEAISHATVIGDRYLVTHNHFKISPAYLGNGTSLYATLYNTSNQMMAETATFTVAYQDAETLILEFTSKGGQGLFDALDIPSAQVLDGESLSLEPGMEVAQINWNGTTTSINCVQIESLIIDEGIARLDLNSSIQPGSSGGGVFWQGQHIANNWQRTTVIESGGTAVLRQYSSAVLNPLPMLALLAASPSRR